MSAHEIGFFKRNLPQLELDEVRSLARDWYGLEGEFHTLHGERDLNFLVDDGSQSFVFKVANPGDDEGIVGFQVDALRHLKARDASLPIPEVLPDKDGRFFRRVDCGGGSHIIRLVSYVAGVPAHTVAIDRDTWRALGRTMGCMNVALASFYHSAAKANDHPWVIANCLQLQPLTKHLGEERELVEGYFDRFRTEVKPRLDKTRHQIIHHDAHSGNVLVDPDNPKRIAGVIDFGDMVHSPVIADLAVATDTSSKRSGDLMEIICDVAAGFDETFPLQGDEIDLVFDAVCARYALSATVVAARNALNTDEPVHLDSNRPFVDALDRLLTIGHKAATRHLRRACRFPLPCPASPTDATDQEYEDKLLDRRHRHMGRKAKHFYRRPMHFERAKGVYLHSTDGHRYLDCYNNVPQVGHCHPHVVRAISRQAAALNTNTRYLYGSILEYAERLTEKLAPHLDACVFVNSGSEANDIAWQMAKVATGRGGALIVEDAYHGITEPIRQFSPGRPGVKLPDFLRGLIVPDPYRGRFRNGEPDIAARYAADADRAIGELSDTGFELAAFMVDSAFCSSGVPDVPAGYLREVERRVRAAGGLMICDEVQSGFGRMGQWWGHEHHGVRADIVTMGKPVGNGHPLGVVVTSQDILERFIDATGLFSTFGGNTVACAAGNAVLDVIERDDLIANGREVGDYFRKRLRELAGTQPLIGNVRGHGMLAGVEFVTNPETRAPATAETAALLELMRERRVLIGSEGRDENILKLRPSLVFRREHVDCFVEALDDALGEIALSKQ